MSFDDNYFPKPPDFFESMAPVSFERFMGFREIDAAIHAVQSVPSDWQEIPQLPDLSRNVVDDPSIFEAIENANKLRQTEFELFDENGYSIFIKLL